MVHAHVGVGECVVCLHYGDDCTGDRSIPVQSCPERLFRMAEQAQESYWIALRAFELSLGLGDIDGLDNLDLCNETLESIRERFCHA